MEREALQKELQNIIETGDDALLEALHEVAKDYDESFELSEEELKELDRRREEYLSGKGKSYTWAEAMEIVRQRTSAR